MEKQEFKVTTLLRKLTSEKNRHRGRGEKDTCKRRVRRGGGERARKEEQALACWKERSETALDLTAFSNGAVWRASWRPLPAQEN